MAEGEVHPHSSFHPRTMPASAWCSRGLGGEPLVWPGRPWVVVDTETTGLDPTRHELTEAAAIVVEPGSGVIAEHVWVTNDGDEAMVRWAEAVERAMHVGVLVAHNLRFDLAFLENDARIREHGVAWPRRWLCTLNIGGARRSLQAFAIAEGLVAEAPHTALGDARTLAAIVDRCVARAASQEFKTVAGIVVALPTTARRRADRETADVDVWVELLNSLDHVVPVRPLTAEDRALVRALFLTGSVDPVSAAPADFDAAIVTLRKAGITRLALLRLLTELGVEATSVSNWADALPR